MIELSNRGRAASEEIVFGSVACGAIGDRRVDVSCRAS
jgi:hypothetical protein